MGTDQTKQLILAIGIRDNFLRVYQNDQDLIANAGPGELSGPIEFFDTAGRRVAGVYDEKWRLLALTPTTGQPDLPGLLQRVRHTIESELRSFLEGNPEKFEEFRTEAKRVLNQLPGLSTSADLRELLQNLFSLFTLPQANPDDPPLAAVADPAIPLIPQDPENELWRKVFIGHGN